MEIREATREDVPAILGLIKGLAEYEKEPHEVINTVEKLTADIFDHQHCEAIVADEAGEIIGFAIYFTAYSTWKGPIIYLEDIYVLTEKRGSGAGSALFDRVVDIAKERKVARMDWQVLDWNEPALEFYRRKGAIIDEHWHNGRLFFRENEER